MRKVVNIGKQDSGLKKMIKKRRRASTFKFLLSCRWEKAIIERYDKLGSLRPEHKTSWKSRRKKTTKTYKRLITTQEKSKKNKKLQQKIHQKTYDIIIEIISYKII